MGAVFGFQIAKRTESCDPHVECPQSQEKPNKLMAGLKGFHAQTPDGKEWLGPTGAERRSYTKTINPDVIVQKSKRKLAKAIEGIERKEQNLPFRDTFPRKEHIRESYYRKDFYGKGINNTIESLGARTTVTRSKNVLERNILDIEKGTEGANQKWQTDVTRQFLQQSKRTSMQIEELYKEYIQSKGDTELTENAFKTNDFFQEEFINIRNGRDYVNLLKKFGIDFAIPYGKSRKLAISWGASSTQADKIKEILKQIERELQKLELELES